MKGKILPLILLAVSFLTGGCYTAVGVAEEDHLYGAIEHHNEEVELNQEEELTSGYFDEEVDEYYDEENTVDFLTVFSETLSGFISSGTFSIIIDLSSSSSNSSSESYNSANTSRNNSGSRNYDGR